VEKPSHVGILGRMSSPGKKARLREEEGGDLWMMTWRAVTDGSRWVQEGWKVVATTI